MIRLAGSVKRSFLFPSDLQTALSYYANMEQLFQYLPHITLIQAYSPTEFQVRYHSTELSIYNIELYCDIEVIMDVNRATVDVITVDSRKPIKPKAGMHSIRGLADYSSLSTFKPEGDCTRIYYHLNLKGSLPKPLALKFVPDTITDHIAESIAQRRIFEIADGFIGGSLKDYGATHPCSEERET